MADLPSANTSVQATAGAVGSGTDLCCIWSPCAVDANVASLTPRVFGSAKAVYQQHGYCEGVELAELHVQGTGRWFLFMPLPIATLGAIGRKNTTGNTGTSVVNVAAGGTGVLGEHDGKARVIIGGTIGTSQILLEVSLDGGTQWKRMRLGTASSLALPYVNATLTFAAGTLVAGDTIIEWHGSAPRSDATGWAAARAALAAQTKQFRAAVLCGDLQNDTEAQALTDQINAYETSNDRFVFMRASVFDRLPLASLSHEQVRMTGSPTLTFAEVGATADTITRSAGSWITDGFVVGDFITITGAITGQNNLTSARIVTLSATVITLDTDDLAAEVGTANCTVIGKPGLTFAEVGATGDTITRNRGSWVADGFRAGDLITVSGSGSNNFTGALVNTVTALVLTLNTQDLAAELVSTGPVTIAAGQTKAAWAAALDTEFEPIDAEPRIGLSMGRGRVFNPFSGWFHRRPPSWAATVRSFQNDLHITTWRKDDGPIGYSLEDSSGALVEYDDRVDGAAASAARFTSFRTWANGPGGTFLSQDLTRDSDGSIVSYAHNEDVTNLICTIVQATTENFIGRTPPLNDDGTLPAAERSALEAEVNSQLTLGVLQDKKGQGARASKAVWTANSTDVLNVPGAILTGVCEVVLNGTIHTVNTTVRIRTAGQ